MMTMVIVQLLHIEPMVTIVWLAVESLMVLVLVHYVRNDSLKVVIIITIDLTALDSY